MRALRIAHPCARIPPIFVAPEGCTLNVAPLKRNSTMKRLFAVSLCLLALSFSSFAKSPKACRGKKLQRPRSRTKLTCRRIWMAGPPSTPPTWPNTMPAARTPSSILLPLKYDSWDEYQNGVKPELSGYKSAKFAVNDDLDIHPHGDLLWPPPRIKEEMTRKPAKLKWATSAGL